MTAQLHIVCVALNGRFISISIRGSDCSHNLSKSIWVARFLSVCQLPNVHFIWQTAHSSVFTKHDGNQTMCVSPAMAFRFCPAPVKTFQTKPRLSWGGQSGCVCVYCVYRAVNMIHHGDLIISLLQYKANNKSCFLLLYLRYSGRLKCMDTLYFAPHFYRWRQARFLHGWLVCMQEKRMIYRSVELKLAFLTHLCFHSLYKVKCLDTVVFHQLLSSIIWSVLCLEYACRFTICFISATLLKALNRLIIDIIGKCHPLWQQMWIALAVVVENGPVRCG